MCQLWWHDRWFSFNMQNILSTRMYNQKSKPWIQLQIYSLFEFVRVSTNTSRWREWYFDIGIVPCTSSRHGTKAADKSEMLFIVSSNHWKKQFENFRFRKLWKVFTFLRSWIIVMRNGSQWPRMKIFILSIDRTSDFSWRLKSGNDFG